MHHPKKNGEALIRNVPLLQALVERKYFGCTSNRCKINMHKQKNKSKLISCILRFIGGGEKLQIRELCVGFVCCTEEKETLTCKRRVREIQRYHHRTRTNDPIHIQWQTLRCANVWLAVCHYFAVSFYTKCVPWHQSTSCI